MDKQSFLKIFLSNSWITRPGIFCTFFTLILCSFASLYGSDTEFLDFLQSTAKNNCLRHEKHINRLNASIPEELQNLPYAIYPGNVEYNTVRFNYNQRFNVFPKAIISPRTVEEAQYVLTILKRYGLMFSIRSGGHCFEPGSLSSDYIFDLHNFNSIVPNVKTKEVYIGAGCLLNQVIATLGALNYAIPTGTCPTVCVTGLTLGGGIGLLVRTYGLTCDSVVNITLLNANAEVIEVNDHSHPDLFWALKGGGNGSYGIVLGFVFKMHYIPKATFFELAWDWKPKNVTQIIEAWQEWVEDLPANISTSIRLEYKEGVIRIRIIGIKVGQSPFTEWEKTFKPFDPMVTIVQGTYLDTVKYWSSEPSLPFNKSKSKILLHPLSRSVIHKIVKYLDFLNKKQPNLRIFLNFDGFGGNVPHFNNSFPFKNAFGWWYQAVYWPYQTQDLSAQRLINRIYYGTAKEISKYSYANVPDYELGERYLQAYYAKNVDKLIQIKNTYDSRNIFHWHQSIPLCPLETRNPQKQGDFYAPH